MLIGIIIGLLMAALVAYGVFMPYKATWNADMYESPQAFTEAGLEAEWGTPRDEPEEVPELTYEEGPNGNWSVSRRLATAVEPPKMLPQRYPAPVLTEQQQGRRRTTTSIGWLAPDNTVVPGVRPVNRSELAAMIHEKMCLQGCTGPKKFQATITCDCGMVTRYANSGDGIVSGISV